MKTSHSVKSVVFGIILVRIFLHSEKYFVSLRIQPKWEKMRTRITPNTNTFYAVSTGQTSGNSYSLSYNFVVLYCFHTRSIITLSPLVISLKRGQKTPLPPPQLPPSLAPFLSSFVPVLR